MKIQTTRQLLFTTSPDAGIPAGTLLPSGTVLDVSEPVGARMVDIGEAEAVDVENVEESIQIGTTESGEAVLAKKTVQKVTKK